jgi:hypothetical protein
VRTFVRRLVGWLAGLRTLWLILGVTLALIVLMEGSLRVVRAVKRSSDRATYAASAAFQKAPWAREYVDELTRDLTTAWRPYVHWRCAPISGRYINVDQDGIRRTAKPEVTSSAPAAAPAKKHVIWLFGGSAAWGWGARDEHTIASELAHELAQAGFTVEVVNRAQIGYVSTQETLALYDELRRGGKPDAVVFLSGYNDLMAALQEGVAGLPQNENNRRAEFNIGLGGALGVETRRSATMWLVRGLVRKAGGARDARQTFGGPGQPTVESLGKDVARLYADNIQLIEALRSAHGFEALYYWQPVVFGKKKLVADEEQSARTWPAMEQLLGYVRAQFGTLAPLADSPRFRDLSGLFDDTPEATFIDTCHFSEPHNRIVAREIARDLVPLLKARETAPAP